MLLASRAERRHVRLARDAIVRLVDLGLASSAARPSSPCSIKSARRRARFWRIRGAGSAPAGYLHRCERGTPIERCRYCRRRCKAVFFGNPACRSHQTPAFAGPTVPGPELRRVAVVRISTASKSAAVPLLAARSGSVRVGTTTRRDLLIPQVCDELSHAQPGGGSRLSSEPSITGGLLGASAGPDRCPGTVARALERTPMSSALAAEGWKVPKHARASPGVGGLSDHPLGWSAPRNVRHPAASDVGFTRKEAPSDPGARARFYAAWTLPPGRSTAS